MQQQAHARQCGENMTISHLVMFRNTPRKHQDSPQYNSKSSPSLHYLAETGGVRRGALPSLLWHALESVSTMTIDQT